MKKKVIKILSVSIIVGSIALSSIIIFYQPSYLPKPYGYNYISLPVPAYQILPDSLPYCFEFSKYALLSPYKSPKSEPYWLTLHYPCFEADIQLTYKPVNKNIQLLKNYLNDAYQLTHKHHIRAYKIEEQLLQTPHGVQVTLVTIKGQVPTSYQFYTTDSVNHFLRGALYFNTAIANDSLAPIINFIKDDIKHMLYTLEWKGPDKITKNS